MLDNLFEQASTLCQRVRTGEEFIKRNPRDIRNRRVLKKLKVDRVRALERFEKALAEYERLCDLGMRHEEALIECKKVLQ